MQIHRQFISGSMELHCLRLDNLVILANAFDVAMDDIIVVEDKAAVHVGA